MTNEDAIILLKDCIRIFENGKDRTAENALVYLEQHIEALNMAIYALEQIAPVTKGDEEIIATIYDKYMSCDGQIHNDTANEIIKLIKENASLKKENASLKKALQDYD